MTMQVFTIWRQRRRVSMSIANFRLARAIAWLRVVLRLALVFMDGWNQLVVYVTVHIVDLLVHICNLYVDKATWPDALKIAEVIPIHKFNEKLIPTNYRPISLISNIAEIFEKIVHNRIINSCDLLTKNQYGFRKNRSTKDALFQISNMIYNNIDTRVLILR